MCEFSQKFKTFCLNLSATKFYPNLLASHPKFSIKRNHIQLFSNYGKICDLDFMDFIWMLVSVFEFETIQIQTYSTNLIQI
jgi:hypothetical protein